MNYSAVKYVKLEPTVHKLHGCFVVKRDLLCNVLYNRFTTNGACTMFVHPMSPTTTSLTRRRSRQW